MTTTALAVEILVIGYQGLIWLVLAAFLFLFCDYELLQGLKEWKGLLVIGSLVTAYTTGAIINAAVSRITETLKIDSKIYNREEPPSVMRAAILIQKPEAYMHIMKNFDLPRVLRSTILNFIFIGIFAFIHLYRVEAITYLQLLIVCVIFMACIVCAAWAYYETTENFYIHLTTTYNEVMKRSSGTN